MMRYALILFFLWPVLSWAELSAPLEQPKINPGDTASLRRGAKLYVDRCLGCHGLKHLRYLRLKQDLSLSDEEFKTLFPWLDRPTGALTSNLRDEDAQAWFGVPAPDLSERAKALGTDWLYTYLKSFYADDSRPFGVNNWVSKDVAMPNVLWDLQGKQKAVINKGQIERLEIVEAGSLSPQEFDRTVTDLVNFLAYAAEPTQLERRRLGKYVIGFLLVLTFVAYRLKKAYWKDIH
ncbi:MAG: cytochrome c1 [Methylohalobius sp.]|nr:cytochrome c1 [Methylohalobius sp.]